MDFLTIDSIIETSAEQNNIDLRTIKNNINQFYFLLSEVGNEFKHNGTFLYNHGKQKRYSIFLVGYFVSIFERICFKYGFVGSLLMYSFFVGIPINTIRNWIKKYSDVVISDDVTIIYNKYFNDTFNYNQNYYNNVLCEIDSDKIIEELNGIAIYRIKSIQDIADSSTDDKLRNSSQIVGQITLHNDKLINRITENRTAMLLDTLPVLSLEKSHDEKAKNSK